MNCKTTCIKDTFLKKEKYENEIVTSKDILGIDKGLKNSKQIMNIHYTNSLFTLFLIKRNTL